MSRNACMQCRLRKVKCNQSEFIGDRCQRCISRNIPCSKTGGTVPSRPNECPSDKRGIEEESPDGARSAYRSPTWLVLSDGRPRARDILREEILTVELLRLYFANYSDVHFMFDKENFLRKYLKGEISKLILYSMISLSARFSNDPVFENVPEAHRGDVFYEEARQLLKSEFDLISTTLIQAYVLLSTYHLTFGGSKRSWTYLGAASNLAQIMELAHDDEPDPLEKEMCKRLLCTIALMDRTLSLSLNVSCHLTPDDLVPEPCSENELRQIRSRSPPLMNCESPENLTLGILDLAKSFCEICFYHRYGGPHEEWQRIEAQMTIWYGALHERLVYTRANFDAHHARHASREFIYLHLLYHHVCQLIYFPFLQANGDTSYRSELGSSYIARCHHHAQRIVEIIEETWTYGGFDLHNASIGQILSVAAAVHMHVSFTSNSTQHKVSTKANLLVITNCLARLKEHTRIFDRIVTRVDAFLEICRRSTASQRVFDKNERLLRQILHYGTASERSKYGDTGRENKQREQPNLASSSTILPRLGFVASDMPLDLNSPSAENSTSHAGNSFQNYAWIFSDSSLNDLYSMSFVSPNSSMNGLDQISGQALDADFT